MWHNARWHDRAKYPVDKCRRSSKKIMAYVKAEGGGDTWMDSLEYRNLEFVLVMMLVTSFGMSRNATVALLATSFSPCVHVGHSFEKL